MSDLKERLRAPLGVMQCEVSIGPAPENRLERRWLVALEAADRIEQLEAALRDIIIHCDWPDRVEKYARAVLGASDE